jgi:hypothetical protein
MTAPPLPPSPCPLLVRWRAWRSRTLLGAFGVRLGHRSARWLAAVATPRAITDGDTALDAAAAQLAARYEHGRSELQRRALTHRAARLAAAREALERAVADTERDLDRARSSVPDRAVEEPPSRALRVALVAVLLAESAMTYEGIQSWAPGEPVVALAVATVLAPMLVALVAEAGAVWRRRAWGCRSEPVELLIGCLAPLVASVAAAGLALGRIGEAATGVEGAVGIAPNLHAAVLTSIGFQATLLMLAFVHGYRHASASRPLARARVRLDAASRRLAQNEAARARLAHRLEHRLEALAAQHTAVQADLVSWFATYSAPLRAKHPLGQSTSIQFVARRSA